MPGPGATLIQAIGGTAQKADLTPEQTENVLRFVLTTRVDLAAK